MPEPVRRKDSGLAAIAWALNGLALSVLLIVGIIYFARRPAEAAPVSPLLVKGTPRPTLTPAPTSYYLPTVTPNPIATIVEDYATPTPFLFADGPEPGVTGYSVEGRPIDVYGFGQGETNYLIVAGIHGGYEGNTVDLANQMLVYLNAHPETIPGGATLYIIPDMNPDAVARGRNASARVNDDGVDLNRNFPTHNWTSDWDHSRCWNERPTTGGPSAGSEPETRAVISFIRSHRIEALISYHAAALGVFPGGDPWQPASRRLARMLSVATGYPYPPIDIGCTYTGTLADWAVENGVQAAVDMELKNHHDSDFAQNLKALKVLVNFIAE
ncbi:MAG TPA: M14 family zinc carboxypeptidase [Anaerolineales bacterium]|nr:M14 family zinc carboxypeptidase [Anaerolineales bacterium]